MEIRQKADPSIPTISSALQNALAALEANVDKTVIQPFTIDDDQQAEEVGEALVADKREMKRVDDTLRPFAALANRAHKFVTGEINRYSQYAIDRYAIRDEALTDRERRRLEADRAEKERAEKVAREEERRRVEAEAKAMEDRAKKEKRPELRKAAEDLRNAPAREVNVTIGRPAPKRAKGHAGFRKRFIATVVNEEALIMAIGRRAAYIEIAKFFDTEGNNRKRSASEKKLLASLAAAIYVQANNMPQIPTSVVEPRPATITSIANDTNGTINWPGVSIDEEMKASTRIR